MKMFTKCIRPLNFNGRLAIAMTFLVLLFSSAKCSNEDDEITLQDDTMDQNDSGDETGGPTFDSVTRISPSGIENGDFFGYALAATTEFTAVSAPFDNEKGARSGAVYIFKRAGLVFETTSHIIYPESPTTEDHFGWALAIDNETLVIGSPKNDKNGENAGVVNLYRHSGNNQWVLLKEIEAPNAEAGQEFGSSVALENGILIVASKFDAENYYDEGGISNSGGIAQGSVFLFEETNEWNFSQKLIPKDENGHLWDAFGNALAIDGNTIAVGAPGTDNTTYKAPGSVYLFGKSQSTWEQQSRLVALDGETDDFFGSNLSLDGNTLAITSPGSYNSLMPNLDRPYGAAYVFTDSGTDWSQEMKLLPTDVVPDDNFGGGGIDLHQDFLVVGAPLSEEVTKSNGSAYFFKRHGNWSESHKIIAPDPLNEDAFGGSIAATNDLIFVGAHRRCNATGCWAGALYFVQ